MRHFQTISRQRKKHTFQTGILFSFYAFIFFSKTTKTTREICLRSSMGNAQEDSLNNITNFFSFFLCCIIIMFIIKQQLIKIKQHLNWLASAGQVNSFAKSCGRPKQIRFSSNKQFIIYSRQKSPRQVLEHHKGAMTFGEERFISSLVMNGFKK